MKSLFKGVESINKSVFVTYIISYVSWMLLSCALLGILFFWFAVRELRTTTIHTIDNKMKAVLHDVQEQLRVMNDVSLDISQTQQFQPAIFRGNKYYESELLKYFKQYKQSSVLSQDYFLIYKDSDTVFQSTGYINYFKYYCWYVLNIKDDESLLSMITAAKELTVLAPDGKDFFIIAIPIHTKTNYDISGNATLCYIVSRHAVEKRVEEISGGLGSNFSLSRKDILMTSRQINTTRESFVSVSDDDMLRLTVELQSGDIFSGLNIFSTTALVVFGLFFLLILSFALYAAYRNYSPIRAIGSKYISKNLDTRSAENELDLIDHMLDDLIQKEILTSKQMQEQLSILKEQLLNLLFNGNSSQKLQSRLKLLGISLPGPYFCVYSCTIEAKRNPNERVSLQELLLLIEELSEEDIHIYPAMESDSMVIILASLQEFSLCEEAAELITSLFEAEGFNARIAIGQICDSLQRIPASYLSSRSIISTESEGQLQSESCIEGLDSQKLDPVEYISALVEHMLSFIKEGNLEKAEGCLKSLTSILHDTRSLLMQKYIFCDIASNLVRTGWVIKHPLTDRQIGSLLAESDPDSLYESVRQILKFWYRFTAEAYNQTGGKNVHQIIEYINEHCTSYDLSLVGIAEIFDISPTQLSRDFKQATGQNYRDYLIKLRVENAKKLLLEEKISIEDTCRRIGYANTSHFIKVFRQITGITPARYKESKHKAGGFQSSGAES